MGPLDGLRVVELAGLGPGPHAAMMLSDLGADVVRVERPATSSITGGGVIARGRSVLTADLKHPDAQREVAGLIDRADVLLEGFRPGVTERLGLGPEVFRTSNPGLIYVRVTGWGQSGPLSDRAGHDLNYIALSGALASIGDPDRPPTVPLNLLGDYGGGSMLAVVGTLTALVERSLSGQGQVVDAAMVDGTSMLMQIVWSLRADGRWSDGRGQNMLDGGAPYYSTYPCSDGRYLAVGAIEPAFYELFVSGIGLRKDELPDREVKGNWPALRDRFASALATRTRDEWAETFAGTDACVTPVLELDEVAEHPHIRAREAVRVLDGAPQAMPAPRLSRTPAAVQESHEDVSVDEVLGRWQTPSPHRPTRQTAPPPKP